MEAELKELKSVLRALVVSSPSQVDAHSLLRDYRQMVGAHIPVAKYGYRDALGFLKERCSDCFLFQGPPNNPVLTLIVPDTLKHIDKFVQSQKPSTTTKFKGKRRSVPGSIVQPEPDLIYKSFKGNININMKQESNCNGTTQQSLPPKEKHNVVNDVPKIEKQAVENNIRKVEKQATVNDLRKIEKLATVNDVSKDDKQVLPVNNTPKVNSMLHDDTSNNNEFKSERNLSNAVKNFLKKKIPLYNDIESECYEQASSKDDNDSGRQTSSSTSSSKAARLEELKREIQDLLADHPDGVLCTDLIALYRERYHRELQFEKFGYTSIVSLLCVLEDAVSMSRPGFDGERVLRDARAEPAPAWLRPPPARRAAAPRPAASSPTARHYVDVDDALPGIDYEPDVFPTDCMHFMESIPALSLSGLEPGAMLEVIVGEVYSPSHFWLIRLGEQYHLAMDSVMDEMTEYYSQGEGKDRFLALGAVRVGHYCTSLYERDWHRSLIVSVIDSDTVKVRHVDYGTVDRVSTRTLKPLLRRFGALPAQAIRARLAGVRPPAAGRRWPHAAAGHLLNLVRDARLVANLVATDAQEDVLEVFLVDTSTAEDVCINSELIRAGYADPRPDSAVRTGECYLLPTFEALEAGATPNYAEIDGYLRDGISLDFVEDYRRHVPHCPPPRPTAAPSPAPTPPPTPPVSPLVSFMTRVPLFPPSAEAETEPCEEPPSSPCSESDEPAPTSSRPPSPPSDVPSQPAAVSADRAVTPPATGAGAEAETTGTVTLTAAECDMFRYLSTMDLSAAHWYMMGALGRSAPAAAPPTALNVAAPEFRPRAQHRPPFLYVHPPPPPLHPAQYPLHPGPHPMHHMHPNPPQPHPVHAMHPGQHPMHLGPQSHPHPRPTNPSPHPLHCPILVPYPPGGPAPPPRPRPPPGFGSPN